MKKFARIIGTGSYLPSKVVTNFDLEKLLIPLMSGLPQEQALRKEEL
jgi:3-oxoacyl-[acyl-carrier-protein] synthase III